METGFGIGRLTAHSCNVNTQSGLVICIWYSGLEMGMGGSRGRVKHGSLGFWGIGGFSIGEFGEFWGFGIGDFGIGECRDWEFWDWGVWGLCP